MIRWSWTLLAILFCMGSSKARPSSIPAPEENGLEELLPDGDGTGYNFGHGGPAPSEGGSDAVDVRDTPYGRRIQQQQQQQQQNETIRQVTTQVQTQANDQTQIREIQNHRIPLSTPLLDDLRRRAELSKQGSLDQTPDWGERAKQWSNSAFSEGLPPGPSNVPAAPERDKILQGELNRRKEKGVRMFFDPNDLEAVMSKSEERALEMVEKMDRELVRTGDAFNTLRDMKRRLTAELTKGKITAKLGYTKMPWSGVNESLIALSLKNLMSQVDKGGELSDETRTLGRLKRVLGYMLDTVNDDVVLIGVPGDKDDKACLQLDDLTLALRCVWIDNQRPGCSLDPDPSNFGAQQKVRVFGVPKDSNMALVMLDADYEMKKINFGVSKFDSDPIPGFVSNVDLYVRHVQENPDKKLDEVQSRFWLTPMRPEPGDMMVEPGRKFMMFQTRVSLMTESMAVSGNALVGTGKVNPVDDASSRLFTAHYEAIETRRVVFRQLHALFDLVMFAQLLRENGVQSPLLGRVAARQTKPVKVADAYDGVTREVQVEGTKVRFTVRGGVMVYLKLRRKYYRDLEQKEIRELENSIMDSMCGRSQQIGDLTALRALLKDRMKVEKEKREADLLFERGTEKFTKQDYAAAEKFFSKAMDKDEDFPEACCQRAMCRWLLKRYKEAIADCALAMKKDPELWTSYWIRAKVKLEMGDKDGAKVDWDKYRELIVKDKFLKEMLGKKID